jgi:hypothetical protein
MPCPSIGEKGGGRQKGKGKRQKAEGRRDEGCEKGRRQKANLFPVP